MATFSTIAELKFVADISQLRQAAKEYDDLVAKTKGFTAATGGASNAQKTAATDADKFIAKLKAQAEAVGKTKAELMQLRAAQLGVSQAAAPYIATLAQAQTQQTSLRSSISDLGNTIKGFAGTLQQVGTGGTSATSGLASLASTAQVVNSAASGMGAGIALAGAALGTIVGVGLLAAASLVAITLNAAAAAAELDDLSNETGIAAERLSLLSALAHEGGSSFDAWNQAAEGMAAKLAKQDEESGKVSRALDMLGVKQKDVNGEQKTNIELMREVITAAGNYKDRAEGQALAVIALGSNYHKLKTSVIEADEKQSDMYDTMKKTGQLMKTELGKASGDFMDKIDHLKGAFTGMANSIAVTVLPYLDSFLGKMVQVAEKAADIIRRFSGNSTAVENTGDALSLARSEAANVAAAIQKMESSRMHTEGGESNALKAQRSRLTQLQENIRELSKANQNAVKAEEEAKTLALKGDRSTENNGAGGAGVLGKLDKDKGSKSDPYGDLMRSIGVKITESNQEIQSAEKLNDAQKMRVKFLADIETGTLKVTAAQKMDALSRLGLLDLSLREAEAQKGNADSEKKNAEEQNKQALEREAIAKRFSDAAQQNLQAIDIELSKRGKSQREISLENDIRQIENDRLKERAELIKQNASAEDLQGANARAQGRIGQRRGKESLIDSRDADWYGGLTDGLKDYAGTFKSEYQSMKDIGMGVASSLEQGFKNMATTGKLSFKDFARSVLADLGAMAARAAITGIAKFILGGVTGGWQAAGVQASGAVTTPVAGGSVVGTALPPLQMATGTNYVPYDGFAATLHEGEAVIPKKFNPAAGGVSAAQGVVNHINITVQGGKTNDETGATVSQAVVRAMEDIAKRTADSRIGTSLRPGGLQNPMTAVAY